MCYTSHSRVIQWALTLIPLCWLVLISEGQSIRCEHGDIRLAGGSTRTEGRVEVCVNDEWGTVCDNSFVQASPTEAVVNDFRTVVCRQLGLTSDENGNITTDSFFGMVADPESVPIHIDNVICTGEERGILDCTHDGVGVHNCDHSQNTGVRCTLSCDSQSGCIGTVIVTTKHCPGCVVDSVRLADGDSYNSGRVELCYKGAWHTVAEAGFTAQAATVVCRQLGFSDTGTEIPPVGTYEAGFGVVVSLAGCDGDETEFAMCGVSRLGNYNHTHDSGVVCERCTDRCDLGSTRDACLITEFTTASTTPTSTDTTPTSTDTTPTSTGTATTKQVDTQETTSTTPSTVTTFLSSTSALTCSDNALGAALGILLVFLIGVVIGWVISCTLMLNKMKGGPTVKPATNRPAAAERGRNYSLSDYAHRYSTIDLPPPIAENSGDYILNESYGRRFFKTNNLAYATPHQPPPLPPPLASDDHSYDTATLTNPRSAASLPMTANLAFHDSQHVPFVTQPNSSYVARNSERNSPEVAVINQGSPETPSLCDEDDYSYIVPSFIDSNGTVCTQSQQPLYEAVAGDDN